MRSLRFLSILTLLLTPGLGGCRAAAPVAEQPQATVREASSGDEVATPPPADWPRVLVVGPGVGPALYLGSGQDAPAIGYLNQGLRIRLESGPQNGRIEVSVSGQVRTRAWIPLARVAAYAQVRGRVTGTRGYLGANDMVSVLGPDGEGQMNVEVRPWLGGENFLGPFAGTFTADNLASQPTEEEGEPLTTGECFVLPEGEGLPIYDRMDGEEIAHLPGGLAVTVLRQRSGWFGVRAGFGPYITGYVRGALTACVGEMPTPESMTPTGDGERPYWIDQEQGSLYQVAAGTRIQFHGQTIARLRGQGWARELGRQEGGLVDVFLAVDDTMAIRGLVPASALTLIEAAPSAAPAAPVTPPEPEEPLPDELAD